MEVRVGIGPGNHDQALDIVMVVLIASGEGLRSDLSLFIFRYTTKSSIW